MDTAFNNIQRVSDICEFLEYVFDLLLFELACIEITLIEIWLRRTTIQKLLQNTHLYEIAEKSPQHFEG
jgi:hypothetical protein